jgi:hypothetical protein
MRVWRLAVRPSAYLISNFVNNFDNIFATLNTLVRNSDFEILLCTVQENFPNYHNAILEQTAAILQKIFTITPEN